MKPEHIMDRQGMSNDFHMELGGQLFIQIQGMAGRLKSTLVGGQRRKYLITTTPMSNGIDAMVYEGISLTVTFLQDGAVYGFRSQVLHRLLSPARIIFLAYPESIERHELRKHQRVECNIPTKVTIEAAGNPLEGIIADISTGGCKVIFLATSPIVHERIRAGDRIDLSFDLMGIGGVDTLKGIIKSFNVDEMKFVLGVSFQDSNEEDVMRALATYVQNVMMFH